MIIRFQDKEPQWNRDECWIAPNATMIGNVRLAREVSVWFGAVIRGDNEPIEIGARSNVQDLCVLHTDPGFPITIGTNCTLGHHAIVHGCSIGNNTMIGMGAIVLNGATIGDNCLIGAGALVPEGVNIPNGSLVVGLPGKVKRELTAQEIERITRNADVYVNRFIEYRKALEQV